jgi:hypothetical protein
MKLYIKPICVLIAALFFANTTNAQLASDVPAAATEKPKAEVIKTNGDSAKLSGSPIQPIQFLQSNFKPTDSIFAVSKKQAITKNKKAKFPSELPASSRAIPTKKQ